MQIIRFLTKTFYLFFLFVLVPASFSAHELFAQDMAGTGRQAWSVKINFDSSSTLPMGLKTETTGFSRHTASWRVIPDKDAPSRPNILKITEIKNPSGSQFNICWTDRIHFKDGSIQIKVRADRGQIDQGGGPMWRVHDRNNYYVARLNPLEDNFRIYFIKNGRRVMIGSASITDIKAGQWFVIRIDTKGDLISGWVNGKKLIEVKDSTLKEEGGVGLWSKADAASSFDDLFIEIKK